jgi:hypothetical protein
MAPRIRKPNLAEVTVRFKVPANFTARDAKDCVADFLPNPVVTRARRSTEDVLIYPKVSAAKIIRVQP